MKNLKKISLILITAFSLCSCDGGKHVHTFSSLTSVDQYTHKGICSHCGEEVSENHVFDQEVVDPKYLRKEKTCAEYAVYYKSCKCGKSSGETIRSLAYFNDVAGGKKEHNLTFHPQVDPENGENGHKAYYSCSGCPSLFNENMVPIPQIEVIKSTAKFYFTSRFNGEVKDLIYPVARNYLNSTDPARYLATTSYGSGDSNGIAIKWVDNGAKKPLKLEIATDADFENVYRTYTFNYDIANQYVYNLIPGDVYIKLSDADGEYITDNLKVVGDLRTIYTNGRIKNMRDLGGWPLGDGHKIKYGLIYRSAEWASAKNCESYLKELGMKSELDIRLSDSSHNYTVSQAPMDGITYYNYGMGQYTQPIRYSSYNSNLPNTFALLANENAYPLTYHCTAGADRTGTLSFLIGGLLGMSYEDLCKDFELTCFYHSKRWRSGITNNNGTYTFNSNGVMQDDSNNYVAFDLMVNDIRTKYMKNTTDLSQGIRNYLNSLGISDTTLDKVVSILKG